MKRTAWLLLAAICALPACQPPDRDIRVIVDAKGSLIIDFPWSVWRLIGLQDREYCIREIELFDAAKVHWRLKVREANGEYVQCLDVRMPIKIGEQIRGFRATKDMPKLTTGVRYGVGIDGIGEGRVDFVLRKPGGAPLNVSGWDKVMRGPCGSIWGNASCYRRQE